MNESEYMELWDALEERDDAERKLARIAGILDRYEVYEFTIPKWINDIRAVLKEET